MGTNEIHTTRGTIYFIRERDVRTGEISPYVKIGLTEGERSAEERKHDLKTANPRELFVAHAFEVSCVNAVETALRYEFIRQNVRLEWHVFGPESNATLDDAVRRCRELGEEFSSVVAIIEEAKRLEGQTSLGSEILQTEDALFWQSEYHLHHHVSTLESKASNQLKQHAKELNKEGRPTPEGTTITSRVKPGIDWKEFEKKHPDVCDRYRTRRDWRQNFYVSGKISAEIVEQNELIQEVNSRITEFERSLNETKLMDEGMDAHPQLLAIQEIAKFSKVKKELAACHLKNICGIAPGIEGICTWNRGYGDPKLDTDLLKKEQAELLEEFRSSRKEEVARVIKSAGSKAL